MRPSTSIHPSKNHFRNLIIAIGLFSGILITTLAWLKVPSQITTSLSWFSLGLIGVGSFLYLRQPTTPRFRWITVLAMLAAISLVYLFPEMFRPVCGGMPRAFASPSTRCGVCLDHVCEWSDKTHSMHCYCDEWDNTGCTPADPPSIDAELTCDLWGNGSWCAGSLFLDLTAVEPQGQDVMISGDVNGTAFACLASPATSTCSVPLPEGIGNASFTATSASGLTTSGSSSYQHDSVQPRIDGWLNGTNGNNGWFVSSVDVNASASDATPASGIATFEYNLNNNGWEDFPGSLSLSDGVHSLSLHASDVAGNTVETDQTIQIDTITPALDMFVNGTVGANGWYSSVVQVSASASDSGSGVNAVEYDLDGAGWATYSGPLGLSNGVHDLSLRVIDNAGNITEGTQTFSVDTLAPDIDFSLTGTEGSNGWYMSDVQVSASASDAGSGLSALEVSVDSSAWSPYSAPLVFDDGPHTYQFRVTDQAGNLSKTAMQQIQVDTVPPIIDLPESWKLGQTTTFKLQDDGSGLASVRLVIEDEGERYPKVTWDESLESYKFKGEIDWDGRFKDGQLAPPGDGYYAWLKVSDHAGNESMLAGQIVVPMGNFVGELIQPSDDQSTGLISGTEVTDPVVKPPAPISSVADETSAPQSPSVNAPPTISFGGASNSAAQPSSAQTGKASFNAGGVSNSPITNSPSNLLWGATATAALGAFTAEIARRKEAAQAARRVANAAKNQRRKLIEKAYAISQQLKKRVAEARQQARSDARTFGKEEQVEEILVSYGKAAEDVGDAYDQYMAQKAYEAFRAEEVATPIVIQPAAYTPENIQKPKSWWEKALDTIDQNQALASVAIGVAVGVGAVAIIATGGVATPLVIGGAALLAGALTAGGTAALNAHYARPLTQNLLRNVGYSAGSALVTIGIGMAVTGGVVSGAVQQTVYRVGNAVAGYCISNPVVCGRAEWAMNALDNIEQGGLMVKGAIQTWRGDVEGAAQTQFELQMEYMDGGMPGNTVAKELEEEVSEWIGQYGDDVVDFVSLYGDDAIDLIRRYRGDAIEIIRDFGDDGIQLLEKYGDNAVSIFTKYGDESVTILERYGDDILHVDGNGIITVTGENAEELAKELSEFTGEEVFYSVASGTLNLPMSTKEGVQATRNLIQVGAEGEGSEELIQVIVTNSTRGTGNRLVLGKWDTMEDGGGYVLNVLDKDGIFLDTGPEISKLLKDNGIDFWVINENFLESQLDAGIERIDFVSGDIWEVLAKDPKSFRAKEIQWLLEHAPEKGYELVGNSWIKKFHN